MQNQYNVWCKWHPLKTVMLGTTYYPEFYSNIKNNKIKSALQKIAHETHEDLEYYEKVLKDFGCEIIRPDLSPDLRLEHLIPEDKLSGIPRAPLQPRDTQLVIGNKLFYVVNPDREVKNRLIKYNVKDSVISIKQCHLNIDIISPEKVELIYKKTHLENDFPSAKQVIDFTVPEDLYFKYKRKIDFIRHKATSKKELRNQIGAPSVTTVGKDIYVDLPIMDRTFFSDIPYVNENFRINNLDIGGHNDGCFHTVKNGAILSLRDIQNYQTTFPGWDVCYLPGESWKKVQGFLTMKEKVNGSWWVPGEEDNDEFTEFVQTWLDDWVGYVEESVFDVNVLVLDEKHVCVNNMNPIVVDFLKKHGMEAVHVPWRHRYFWDGGLHCITLDLYREGVQEDYFPDRKGPITDDL